MPDTERVAERQIEDIGSTVSRTPLDELQLPRPAAQDKSGRSIVVPDEKVRALLAAILREERKQTLILMHAFRIEIGAMNFSEEDLEV